MLTPSTITYDLMTVAQALGLTVAHTRLLVATGKLAGFKLGDAQQSSWRVTHADLLRYIQRRKAAALARARRPKLPWQHPDFPRG